MAKFVCILEQAGEGCDYTIGCGMDYMEIEANDWNDAFQQVKVGTTWKTKITLLKM